MDDYERRDVRRVGGPLPRRDGGDTVNAMQRQFTQGRSTMVNKKQTSGSSSSLKESSGNAKGLNPASPTPGQGKRPQQDSQDATPRLAQKRLKVDQELCVHVLLPNETAFRFMCDTSSILSVENLIALVEMKSKDQKQDTERSPPRTVNWDKNVWVTNDSGNRLDAVLLRKAIFSSAKSSGTLRVLVHDGHTTTSHKDKSMFDITPEPQILGKLPVGYTLETALADQVDNALQAVWNNEENDIRLVSVTLREDKIIIFDTGQGMDATEENSIQNWGTVGGSMHRAVHHEAIGGEPPFLKPYLGKYGAGGIAAALHLGRSAAVCSKTVASKMVVSLGIEPKVLVENREHDPRERVWKTEGAFRAMKKGERAMSPHGSFTKVEITKLKSQYCIAENGTQYWKVDQIRQLLKDIYFPYIQTDNFRSGGQGSTSRTVCPVTFEVNGENLVGVEGCETAILNMHACNGPPFIFDIQMKKYLDQWERTEGRAMRSKQAEEEANARITCQYYPNQKGREALETVLEELQKLNSNSLTYETMHRVTIRWLGRLLPEAKWPMLPFMEVLAKKETKLGVRRAWGKRVRAFIDTDAGFHPNQSKTQLETDNPFVVALKNIGSEDLSGTSAKGVTVSFRLKDTASQLTASHLIDAYMKWVKDMHSKFDEDFTFVDDAIYLFNHPNAETELGVRKQVIIFHKHMKYGVSEYKVDDNNPLRVKLLKDKNGPKFDLFATVDFFFHDGEEEEHGEVKFLCRPLDVDESDGCKLVRKVQNLTFSLNKSVWYPASILSTAKPLDEFAWRKKIDELSNRSPCKVEILKEEDMKILDMGQAFPVNDCRREAKFEAGYRLPPELVAVVRPKKGTGLSYKQGMIVTEPLNVVLTVRHCDCLSPCWKQIGTGPSGKASSTPVRTDHGQVVSSITAQSTVSRSKAWIVKGLYVFNIGCNDVHLLTKQGIYTFDISVESEKYKDVGASVSSIQISPSKITSKWTLCNHAEDCTHVPHDKMQPSGTVIRLNERLNNDLFLQKYDKYNNSQVFDKPSVDLEFSVLSPKGYDLGMQSIVPAISLSLSEAGRHKLQIKNLLFRSGSLEGVEPTYEVVLRACFPASRGINQFAELSCKVLPGLVASFQVKDSIPSIPKGTLCFQEALRPGDIIKRFTLQGLDAFGNSVEKGQKVLVELEGIEFQDQSVNAREVDDCGRLQLGGLLKVTCSYNCKGSISISSVNGKPLCSVSFETVTRRLLATQVPRKSFVGRRLDGISIEIVDECGKVDTTVDGYRDSITADWLKGVTCAFVRGECVLPDFKLPEKPGMWKGKVYFSADTNLSITISVELELAEACSLDLPAKRKPELLTALCGVPFVVPFCAYDDQHQPAGLTDSMKSTIIVNAEAKDAGDGDQPIFRPHFVKCKDVTMSRTGDIPGYQAHVVLSGSVGTYLITVMDSCHKLKGKVETTVNLVHGHVSRLVPLASDGLQIHSLSRALTTLEVKRNSPMRKLTVGLFDLENNLCSSCEGKLLRMNVLDCQQWNIKTAKVVRGEGQFEISSVVLPVGSYDASVELDGSSEDWYSLDEQIAQIQAKFVLRVTHGNYPSALRLLDPNTVTVSLTEESVQYLAPMTVLLDSADGLRLQGRPTVGVKIFPSSSQEYLGTFVEGPDIQCGLLPLGEDELLAREADGGPVRYVFTEVCVPPRARTYVMKFFVRGTDVVSQSQHLIVRNGPPSRLEIVHRDPGQEMDGLQIHVVDRHGNICEEAYGFEVALDLQISKNFNSTPGPEQCSVYSKTTTIVKRGKADFGLFALNKGIPGMYALKVFGVDCASDMDLKVSLTPAEAQIFITRGNVDETIRREFAETKSSANECTALLTLIKEGDSVIEQRKAKMQSLQDNIRRLQDELRSQEGRLNAVRERQLAAGDDQLLENECALPLRTIEAVEHDIRRWAGKGNTACVALLEAQTNGFLAPQSQHPAAKDVLGPVVMLGRLESEALNRVLSEYLGVHSLLLIVSRTQRGISALEEYNERGDIDVTKGLHGFARHHGWTVTGRYNTLALTDIRPYSRSDRQPAVDKGHPQRLLRIEPSRLPGGHVPTGFLGYAVNLVHLRPEHIQITVATRQPGEYGLRESLFFNLLGLLQVYDTRAHMVAAKEALKGFNNGAISLDGGIHQKNQRQQLGRRNSDRTPISFSIVPPEERMTAGLLPPACYAFQRKHEISSIDAGIQTKQEALRTMTQSLSSEATQVQSLQATVLAAKTEQARLTQKTESIQKRFAELMKAAGAISARSGQCGTPGDSGSNQDSSSHRMRAFMM